MKTIAYIAFVLMLAGCAKMHFNQIDDDTFRLAKNSDACAIGNPESVKNELRMEATKLCAMRRESPVEVESDGEYGIPWLRCASATITFRCQQK